MNRTFRTFGKKIKYIKDRMIQSAVNGYIEEFDKLSEEIIGDIDYKNYLFYSLKHGKFEMIEHLLSKLGTINNKQFSQSLRKRYSQGLGTDQLLRLVYAIDNEKIDTTRLFKYREHIISYFTHECFRKYYPEKLLVGIDLIEPEEVREVILREFIDASRKDTRMMKIFYKSLMPLSRERNINQLLS